MACCWTGGASRWNRWPRGWERTATGRPWPTSDAVQNAPRISGCRVGGPCDVPIRAQQEHSAAQAVLKVGPTQVDDGQRNAPSVGRGTKARPRWANRRRDRCRGQGAGGSAQPDPRDQACGPPRLHSAHLVLDKTTLYRHTARRPRGMVRHARRPNPQQRRPPRVRPVHRAALRSRTSESAKAVDDSRGAARRDHLPHLRLETILLPLSIQDPDQSRAKALRRTSGVRHLRRSAGITPVYHQQTKNLLVSCSPKKPGFF